MGANGQFKPIVDGGVGSPVALDQTYTISHSNLGRPVAPHPVGTRGVDPRTGRAWRFALIGDATLGNAVVKAGLCVASTLSHADHDDITLTDSGTAVEIGDTSFVLRESDVDTTDIIKDQYKDGYLHVQDSTGQGFYTQIVGHDGFDASGSATDGQVHLADPVDVAWAATTQIALSRNEYDRIGPSTTAEAELVVGVANFAHSASGALSTTVDGTESDVNFRFGWIQTWGPCAVLQGGTPTQGTPVMSGSAANEVELWDSDGNPVTSAPLALAAQMAGVTLTGGTADADYALVRLAIAP